VGHQGLAHDEELGPDAIYNRIRYLIGGRYLQRDPSGYPDGLNAYACYAIIYGGVDPYGLETWWNWTQNKFWNTTLGAIEVAEATGSFVTGGADSLSMGLTKYGRNAIWGEEAAEIKYKGAYKAGEYTELAIEITLTGGSAVLKKKAAKEIAERVAREASGDISQEAAERLAKSAEKKIANSMRKEARRVAEANSDEVVHHAHTLIGHPPYPGGILGPSRGPVRSQFPTLGYRWMANNSMNLVRIPKNNRGRHIFLHQRSHITEQLVLRGTNPVLTTTRFGLNQYRDGDLDIIIELVCRDPNWHPPLKLPE